MSNPDLDLDALDALCAATTPGPWVADYAYSSRDDAAHAWGPGCGDLDQVETDAAFIAAARSALPALVARVRALAQENATLQAENTMLHGQHWHLHATMIE